MFKIEVEQGKNLIFFPEKKHQIHHYIFENLRYVQ